nr:hypothetical protein [Planctomycetota bacterium]
DPQSGQVKTYINTIPSAPIPADGDCTSQNNSYTYSSENSSTYTLSYCLGGKSQEIPKGINLATPAQLYGAGSGEQTQGGGACIPNCTNKICGNNGCGGNCGYCLSNQVCENNQCSNVSINVASAGRINRGPSFDSSKIGAISGNYAYFTSTYVSSIDIIDISNKNNPIYVNTFVDGQDGVDLENPHDIVISGNFAYVARGWSTGGVEILDISNPTQPSFVNRLVMAAYSLEVLGNYLYIGGRSSFSVYDISNPSNPVYVDSINNSSIFDTILDFKISGDYAYLTSNINNSLRIINVADPENISYEGGLVDGVGGAKLSLPYGIDIQGNYAFIASYRSYALEIVDITDKTNPVHVSSISSPSGTWAPRTVVVKNNTCFLSNSWGLEPLEIIDISDKLNPAYLGSAGGSSISNNGSERMLLDGNYLYMSTGSENMFIFDVSNEVNPLVLGNLYINSENNHWSNGKLWSEIDGNFMHSLSNNGIFRTFDLSNPVSPQNIFSGRLKDDNGNDLDMTMFSSASVSNNYLYMSSDWNEDLQSGVVYIIDLSVAANPNYIGSFSIPDYSSAYIWSSNNYVVVTLYDSNSIVIANVSNKNNPIVKIINNNDYGITITNPRVSQIEGNYLYVLNVSEDESYRSIEIIDISDINSPELVNSIIPGENGFDLTGMNYFYLFNNYLYINSYDYNNGSIKLSIVNVSDPYNLNQESEIVDGVDGINIYGIISMHVFGNYLLASCNNNGNDGYIEIINIADKANPIHFSTIGSGFDGANFKQPISLLSGNGYLYLFNYSNRPIEILKLF